MVITKQLLAMNHSRSLLRRCGFAPDKTTRSVVAPQIRGTILVMSLNSFYRLFPIALTMLCVSCITFSTSTVSLVDAEKARKFADAFVEDVVNNRRDAMYSKMENEFHEITSRENFDEVLRPLDERFGQITSCKFDFDEPGTKIYTTDKTKPTRRVFYRAATSKGTWPFIVTVVSNGSDMSITEFVFLLESH